MPGSRVTGRLRKICKIAKKKKKEEMMIRLALRRGKREKMKNRL